MWALDLYLLFLLGPNIQSTTGRLLVQSQTQLEKTLAKQEYKYKVRESWEGKIWMDYVTLYHFQKKLSNDIMPLWALPEIQWWFVENFIFLPPPTGASVIDRSWR